MGDQNTTEPTIMAALSTLSPSQLSSLCLSLSSTFRRHRHRLASLLSSPALFSHTLHHLYSLSLPQKSLLIARHLLSFLHILAPFFTSVSSYDDQGRSYLLNSGVNCNSISHSVRLRDLDSVLLLLFFCEVRQHSPRALETPPAHWQTVLRNYCSDTMLRMSGLTVSAVPEVLGTFVDILVKCMRFVGTKGCAGGPERKVAASVAAVVALPSVEVKSGGGGVECVICKEEMREGRDVCELPCHHLFHWMCVLPWLRKRNTCPCCRFRLPTDDVYGEIQRLWEVVVKASQLHLDRNQCT